MIQVKWSKGKGTVIYPNSSEIHEKTEESKKQRAIPILVIKGLIQYAISLNALSVHTPHIAVIEGGHPLLTTLLAREVASDN